MNYPIGLKEFCTGCSACFNICPVKCIDMKMDKEGFLFPVIKSNECTDCQKCKKVCPIPVSYTHLDVYKRQVFTAINIIPIDSKIFF